MRKLLFTALGAFLLIIAIVQFIPGAPLIVPAQLPSEQRAEHRVLNFEGIANFRDLGGYETFDGRQTRWGTLYRSGNMAAASRADVNALSELGLSALIDFRSSAEKEEEPDRLPEPPGFDVVEIPTLDGGDNSVANEIMARIEDGDFSDFDPNAFMLEANRQFVQEFQPQYRQFMQTVLAAEGSPVLWHCSAGKDRAGFAAAILLRTIGVSQETVLDDYLLSKRYAVEARRNLLRILRLLKGAEAAEKLEVLMGVERAWLEAAFDEIDRQYGNFDGYVREGLGLSESDVKKLKEQLLE